MSPLCSRDAQSDYAERLPQEEFLELIGPGRCTKQSSPECLLSVLLNLTDTF